MKALLEASHLNVEAENIRREGVLCGKLFSPSDSLLPRSVGHCAIMGLRLPTSNRCKSKFSFSRPPDASLTVSEPEDYIGFLM